MSLFEYFKNATTFHWHIKQIQSFDWTSGKAQHTTEDPITLT